MADPAISTTAPDAATHLSLFLTRLQRMATVAPIRNFRTADAIDIEETRQAIQTAHDIFVSHVGRLLRELNHNLPVTEPIETVDYFNGLADLHSDLTGLLMAAADTE